jgi:PKD repeat protein
MVTVDALGGLSTGTGLAFQWTFGDGGTGTGAWATHTYAAPGDYTLTLTVTDAMGLTDSATWIVRVATGSDAAPPAPPRQPACGPGGSEYVASSVRETMFGTGRTSYWLFEPQSPAPATAPVVVFLHGFGAELPDIYRPWLEHLARKGRIVIYPRYQEGVDPLSSYYASMVTALTDAFAELQAGSHVRPELDRVAAFGHSFGGVLAANLAATWDVAGLPRPKAVICAHPGVAEMTPGGLLWQASKADYTRIDPSTLMLGIACEDDGIVGSFYAETILAEAPVAAADKDLILVRADAHGQPQLFADHGAPTAVPPNAIDWYGFWKWGDALMEAAFFGRYREYALGDTPQQRFLGRWSDGVPVGEPDVDP